MRTKLISSQTLWLSREPCCNLGLQFFPTSHLLLLILSCCSLNLRLFQHNAHLYHISYSSIDAQPNSVCCPDNLLSCSNKGVTFLKYLLGELRNNLGLYMWHSQLLTTTTAYLIQFARCYWQQEQLSAENDSALNFLALNVTTLAS